MLNIQIRGFLAKVNIKSISKTEKENLLNYISESKMTLTEIIQESEYVDFSKSNEFLLPIVTDDAELILTSFPEDDYYSDGYSFFREKVNKITDKASILENIVVENYGLIEEKIYYGCSFESNVKEVNYQNFDKNHLDIETVSIPFLNRTFINNIFFYNQKIYDKIKSKNQFIKHKVVLYESTYKGNQQNNEESNESEFKIITYSENGNDQSSEVL